MYRDLVSQESPEGVTLWRTEWVQGADLVDATPWTPHPAQAIRDGETADREYRRALRRPA